MELADHKLTHSGDTELFGQDLAETLQGTEHVRELCELQGPQIIRSALQNKSPSLFAFPCYCDVFPAVVHKNVLNVFNFLKPTRFNTRRANKSTNHESSSVKSAETINPILFLYVFTSVNCFYILTWVIVCLMSVYLFVIRSYAFILT